MFASSAPDETMPSKDAIRKVQQQARAGLGAMVSGAFSFTIPVGRGTEDNEDLFLVGLDGREMLWVPKQAKEKQTTVCRETRNGLGDKESVMFRDFGVMATD